MRAASLVGSVQEDAAIAVQSMTVVPDLLSGSCGSKCRGFC